MAQRLNHITMQNHNIRKEITTGERKIMCKQIFEGLKFKHLILVFQTLVCHHNFLDFH